MKKYSFQFLLCYALLGALTACGSSEVSTPESPKWLSAFDSACSSSAVTPLSPGVALYVDYSTCNKLGQDSKFFQALEPTFVKLSTAYFSIKGSNIESEDLNKQGVYERLRNINEVNYADLKKAVSMIADGSQESVLLTDGEYFTQSMAKGNENNPWLAEALKIWLMKGLDVHIFVEPYNETNNSKVYHKKRFYIIFTDDFKTNNVYSRIKKTVNIKSFPQIDEFRISTRSFQTNGIAQNHTEYNPILQCKSISNSNRYEIVDWNGCDWATIEQYIVNAVDSQTGDVLPNGDPIITLHTGKYSSSDCFQITTIGLKFYDINQEYADFYNAKEGGYELETYSQSFTDIPHFMLIDNDEFINNGDINIYFDRMWFTPDYLTGNPYNYFKVDVVIDSIRPAFDRHREKFTFESICNPNHQNESVVASIDQCLADDDIVEKIQSQVLYSIYIKSESK